MRDFLIGLPILISGGVSIILDAHLGLQIPFIYWGLGAIGVLIAIFVKRG